jgi:DNA-binding response OmpR family regulator
LNSILTSAAGCLVFAFKFVLMKWCPMQDQRVKLLIVGDDVSTGKGLPSLFPELRYCVRSVKDGISALSEIRHEFPDILLFDLDMPGMPGVEFLLAVRRLFPSVRVIAMSCMFSGNCVPPGIAADAFFEKGADIAHLMKSVDALTRPERSTKRLSMEDLFGFPMLDAIPSHPGASRLTDSVCQTNSKFLVPAEKEQLEYF